MTRTTRIAGTVIAVALLVAPLTAQAAPRGGHRHHGFGAGPGFGSGPGHHQGPGAGVAMMLHGLLGRLDLDGAQRDQIHELMDGRYEATRDLRAELADRHVALHEAIRADEPDAAAIRAAVLAIAEVEAELAVGGALLLRDVRAVLTPEQLEEARELIDRGRGWRQERRERWRGGR